MKDQALALARLFESKPNEWIPLPDILKTGIAQYNARIYDLRRPPYDMDIKNRWEIVEGVKHSWFMFTPKPVEPILKVENNQYCFVK
jgi:hypothetical protein